VIGTFIYEFYYDIFFRYCNGKWFISEYLSWSRYAISSFACIIVAIGSVNIEKAPKTDRLMDLSAHFELREMHIIVIGELCWISTTSL